MAYSTYTEIRLHAPQAPSGEDFSGYITQADRIIDSRLRTLFVVPFATTPGLITNVSSKLAAAEFLKAHYAKINQEPPEYAMQLYKEAMKELSEILANPNLLSEALKAKTIEDEDRNSVTIAGDEDGVFGMGDETTWG